MKSVWIVTYILWCSQLLKQFTIRDFWFSILCFCRSALVRFWIYQKLCFNIDSSILIYNNHYLFVFVVVTLFNLRAHIKFFWCNKLVIFKYPEITCFFLKFSILTFVKSWCFIKHFHYGHRSISFFHLCDFGCINLWSSLPHDIELTLNSWLCINLKNT